MRNYDPFYMSEILPSATGTCTTRGRKLNQDNVIEIRTLHVQGHSLDSIAERFKVRSSTISNIIHWKSWRDAGGPRDYSKKPLRGEYLSNQRKKLTKSKAPIA